MREITEQLVHEVVVGGSAVGERLTSVVCAGDLGDFEGEVGEVEEYAGSSGGDAVEEGVAEEDLGHEGCRECQGDAVGAGLEW